MQKSKYEKDDSGDSRSKCGTSIEDLYKMVMKI
jgi:hypothetical protein